LFYRFIFLSYHLYCFLDPKVWTQLHVQQWADWVITEYNILNVDPAVFSDLNGETLCAMRPANFYSLINSKNADIFISHLEYLKSKYDFVLIRDRGIVIKGSLFD